MSIAALDDKKKLPGLFLNGSSYTPPEEKIKSHHKNDTDEKSIADGSEQSSSYVDKEFSEKDVTYSDEASGPDSRHIYWNWQFILVFVVRGAAFFFFFPQLPAF